MKFRCTAMFAGHVVSVAILLLTVWCRMSAWTGAVYRWPRCWEAFPTRAVQPSRAQPCWSTDCEPRHFANPHDRRSGRLMSPPILLRELIRFTSKPRALNLWSGQAFLSKWPVTSGLIFSLQPGQVSETVVVNEEVPLLNTTSSTLGGTLSIRKSTTSR